MSAEVQQPARVRAADHVDIVVVGGGAAGCVVARRAAESPGARVLLLEAGADLRHATTPAMRDGWRLPALADLPDWGFESEPNATGATGKVRRGRRSTSWCPHLR